MRIVITVGELMDKGKWLFLCEEDGIDPWAVNEGQVDSGHEVSLDERRARELGLI